MRPLAPIAPRKRARRLGGIYIAVLGASMLVTVLGMAALSAVMVERLTTEVTTDMAAARYAAESGIDLALLTMQTDSNWRTTRPHGTWSTNVPVGDTKVTIEVTDPKDSSLANRATDKVLVKATATKGQARHMVRVQVNVAGDPIDAITSAIHGAGQFRVESGATISVTDAPVSTNGTLSNGGTVAGNVECLVALPVGTITGSTTILSTGKGMPPAGTVALYASLGTTITGPPTSIDKRVLTPLRNNMGGGQDADGVYVINAPTGQRIRESRIHGTLVVRCPGQTLLIEKTVLIERFRADYPVLIVDGDLSIELDGGFLSESALGTNFNPSDAPYAGVTDSDTSDNYPCQIVGLVHATGTIRFISQSKVIGAIVAESGLLTNAVYISGTPRVEYDKTLTTSPPIGYMKNIRMSIAPGSWEQVTGP